MCVIYTRTVYVCHLYTRTVYVCHLYTCTVEIGFNDTRFAMTKKSVNPVCH